MNEQLHKAIITALATGLAPTPIYAQVPQDAARPYVRVSDASGDAWDTGTSDGAKVTLDVVVESDELGSKEALHLVDRLRTVLAHGESLDMAGKAVLVDLWCSPPSVDTLDDGRTTRATVRVSCLIDDIAPTTP